MLHTEVMSAAQQRLLGNFGRYAETRGFVLAGGTAVAIHLGHRRSAGLDWFTNDAIPDPLDLAADLRRAGLEIAVTDTAPGTLHGLLDGVRVSMLEYHYPLLVPLVEWPEYGCQLYAPEDLSAMKLSAVAGRARKDFIDVYALGRVCFQLDRMLELYQEKFGVQDLGHVLMSLTFFDDAEEEETPEMLWGTPWVEVKRSIESWVVTLVERAEPPQAVCC